MTESNETQSPAEALEAIRRTRGAVGERMTRNAGWYDLCYAALAGGMVAFQGFDTPLSVIGTSTCTVFLVVLMQVWTNRTGIRLTGLTPPRARWVAIGLGLVMAFLLFGAAWAGRNGPGWPVVLGLAALGGVLAWLGSRLWLRVFLGEGRP